MNGASSPVIKPSQIAKGNISDTGTGNASAAASAGHQAASSTTGSTKTFANQPVTSSSSASSSTPSSSTKTYSGSHDTSAYWTSQNDIPSSNQSNYNPDDGGGTIGGKGGYNGDLAGNVGTSPVADPNATRKAEAAREMKQIQDEYADLKRGQKQIKSELEKFVVGGSSIGKDTYEGETTTSRGKVQLPSDTSEYTKAINTVADDIDKTERLMKKVETFDKKYGDLGIDKGNLGGIHKELGKQAELAQEVVSDLTGTREKVDEINNRQANLFSGTKKVEVNLQRTGSPTTGTSKTSGEFTSENNGKENPTFGTDKQDKIVEILTDKNSKGTTDAEKIAHAYNAGKINREQYKEAMSNVDTNTGNYTKYKAEKKEEAPKETTTKPSETKETKNETTAPSQKENKEEKKADMKSILTGENSKGTTDAEKITNAYNSGKIDRKQYKEAMSYVDTNTGKYNGPINQTPPSQNKGQTPATQTTNSEDKPSTSGNTRDRGYPSSTDGYDGKNSSGKTPTQINREDASSSKGTSNGNGYKSVSELNSETNGNGVKPETSSGSRVPDAARYGEEKGRAQAANLEKNSSGKTPTQINREDASSSKGNGYVLVSNINTGERNNNTPTNDGSNNNNQRIPDAARYGEEKGRAQATELQRMESERHNTTKGNGYVPVSNVNAGERSSTNPNKPTSESPKPTSEPPKETIVYTDNGYVKTRSDGSKLVQEGTKQSNYDRYGNLLYTVEKDDKGNVTSSSYIDAETQTKGTTHYTKDTTGKQIESAKEVYDNGSGKIIYDMKRENNGDTRTNIYNEDSSVARTEYYSQAKDNYTYTNYGKDATGKQIETGRAEYDNNGNLMYGYNKDDKGNITNFQVGEKGYIPSDLDVEFFKDGGKLDVDNGNIHISYNQRGTYDAEGNHEEYGWDNIRKANKASYEHLHSIDYRGGFGSVDDANTRGIKSSGCGPTATASAIATEYGDTKTANGEPITPDYAVELLPAQTSNNGMEFLKPICEHYDLDSAIGGKDVNSGFNTVAKNGELAMDNLLREGGSVIRSIRGGDHYVAITDIKEENGQKYYYVVDTDQDPKYGTSGDWYLASDAYDPSKEGKVQWNEIKNSGGQTGFIAPVQSEGDTRSISDIMQVDPIARYM